MMDAMIGREGDQKDTLVVRGYAGTGKTTVISALVNALPLVNFKYVLLAPTGRAAKVISSYAGRKAFTIHKIIYKQTVDSKSGELKFIRQKNYFKKTVFIVDEASMISDENGFLNNGLLHDLVNYVFEHRSNKLILIGDNAQLPPVGSNRSPGLEMDYLKANYGLDASEIELNEVVRQEQESGILINATQLRKAVFDEKQKVFLGRK